MESKYVFYVRVSKKGSQHLGIEAQLEGLNKFVQDFGGSNVGTYIEEMSGARDNRPELDKALRHCKKENATLLIYRLDRLSRKVSFVANLLDKGVKFRVCSMPDADEFAIHIYSALSQQERRFISLRTKEALAVVKKNGTVLGRAKQNKQIANLCDEKIIPVLEQCLKRGMNQSAIANYLNELGMTTARGLNWTQQKISNLMRKHLIAV